MSVPAVPKKGSIRFRCASEAPADVIAELCVSDPGRVQSARTRASSARTAAGAGVRGFTADGPLRPVRVALDVGDIAGGGAGRTDAIVVCRLLPGSDEFSQLRVRVLDHSARLTARREACARDEEDPLGSAFANRLAGVQIAGDLDI